MSHNLRCKVLNLTMVYIIYMYYIVMESDQKINIYNNLRILNGIVSNDILLSIDTSNTSLFKGKLITINFSLKDKENFTFPSSPSNSLLILTLSASSMKSISSFFVSSKGFLLETMPPETSLPFELITPANLTLGSIFLIRSHNSSYFTCIYNPRSIY